MLDPLGDEDVTSRPRGFGELLRRYRVAAGLTQEALAEKAGLSVRALSDLERGLRQSPHPDTVRRLGGALKLRREDQVALAASAVSAVDSPAATPTPLSSPGVARPESGASVSVDGEQKLATVLCCQLSDTALLAERHRQVKEISRGATAVDRR